MKIISRLSVLSMIAILAVSGAAFTRELDKSLLDDPSRSDDDRKRDEGFKPLEVYAFFDVAPGKVVADLWPGRGYNTQILSRVVGKKGKVIAILGPLYTQEKYIERVTKSVNERIDNGKLTNVTIVGPLADLEPNSIDVMVTVRNYHDLGEEARSSQPDR